MFASILLRWPVAVLWMVLAALPAGAVERVSIPVQGRVGSGGGRSPSISADGRFVAFATAAQLTPDDRNAVSDVYVRDRVLKTTIRVSDDRGGDQPAISANGRFVVFRALDGLTRLRVVDLERVGITVAAAIPNDTSNYDRPSDSGVISPDGRYVGYAFRPSPDLVAPDDRTRGHQVMVTDLVRQSTQRVAPSSSGSANSIADLGRVAISFDGSVVVFESNASLAADDTNAGPDIYLSQAGALQRISRPASGLPDAGSSRSPAISQDGTRIFFIGSAPLANSDSDGRATLYMVSNVGGTPGAPIPLPTTAIPLALAAQATVSGQSVVFLGQTAGRQVRAVLYDVASGTETIVPTSILVPDAAPVLTGDGSQIAFSAIFQGVEQVYVTPVPGATTRLPPTITIGAATAITNGETKVTEGSSFTITGNGSAPGQETIRLLELDQDGVEVARTTGAASSGSVTYTQQGTRGIFGLRARGFNDAWIEGTASPLRLVVKPKANLLAITGGEDLVQTPSPATGGGSVGFSGTLRIDNTRKTASGPLRVILTDAPTPSIMAFGVADFNDVPVTEENVLSVTDFPAVPAIGSVLVPIPAGSFTSPTERLEGGFKGRGRTVYAHLREQKAGAWASPEDPPMPATLLQTLPQLDENTPLPNGGVPVAGTPLSSPTFNPQLLESLLVLGPGRVGGPSRAGHFAARAVFDTGDRACVPQWSLAAPSSGISISATGVLSVGALAGPRNIMVHASFSGAQADMPVTVFPLPPRVILRATIPVALESGASGEFRLFRSGSTAQDLTVNYTMEGTAENGIDYQALSGAAVISAGQTFVAVPVVPLQDSELEGLETVQMHLVPDAAYQIYGSPTARVTLNDDEALPVDQPDLILQFGAHLVVGALSYQPTAAEDDLKQTLLLNGTRNVKVGVLARVANRGTSPQAFHLQGSPGSVGFAIKYVHAGLDVTDAVVDGTYTLPVVAAGKESNVAVLIVPTADAPIGGTVECGLKAFSDGGSSDLAEIVVKRVH